MKPCIVLALGGNALSNGKDVTAEAQKAVAATASKLIARLAKDYKIVVTHGNGPQVGSILLHEETAQTPAAPAMPLETAVAMSQGEIGYWLAQALDNAFLQEGSSATATALVTQVLVQHDDPAFSNPSKPIGQFYTEEQAQQLMQEKNWTIKPDSDRGWRRVVASPQPIDIIEKNTIIDLLKTNTVVVATGGGGIPVYRDPDTQALVGIDAVIDKDLASEKLAEAIGANIFVSLTAVPNAYINYGKPDQSALAHIDIDTAVRYMQDGQFAEGSMLPKIQSALAFARQGGTSIITTTECLADALNGKAGTIITK